MFGIQKPPGEVGETGPAIIIGLFVAFGGILYGYDTGSINGILEMDYFKKQFSNGKLDASGQPYITAKETSLIVAILSLGTIVGSLAASPVADKLGRRWGMIASCMLFNVGVLLQVLSSDQKLMIAGRCVAGVGVGLVSAMVPLYQSETAPKWIRGTIVGAYQWAITFGIFLAACANHGTHLMNNATSYRLPLGLQFIWSSILIAGMSFLPETPRYLIMTGRYEEAKFAMSKLRKCSPDDPALVEEIDEVQASHNEVVKLGKASLKDCFTGGMYVRLLTGCILQALQQLSGINFIFYYGTYFFQRAGIKNPFIIMLVTNIVNILSTIPGLWLVERVGRRSLLFWGSVGMCVSELIVAFVGTFAPGEAANLVLIIFVCMFISFFAASWGPTAWVVTGEIFPLKIRAKALSMTTCSNWLLNFALSFCTPYLVDSGPGNANLGSKVFFIWGFANLFGALFVWSMIYETKGLSLEDVQVLYKGCKRAWRSKDYVREEILGDVTVRRVGSGDSSELEEKGEQDVARRTAEGHVERVA